ncbi:hypothetical protein [Spirosoma arcticum]
MESTVAVLLPPARPLRQWLGIGLAATPVAYYFIVLIWFAYDMPYMDDYPVLVDFLNKLPDASTGERWRLLLEQNNFHRVVWVKGIAWLMYALTGHVNFTFLQLLGNASLLLVGWLLYKALPKVRADYGFSSLMSFLPVLFFLFQFQSWNNAFWAMAAMSNLWAPAWALLAFWLASRQREGWALLVGVLALLTNGNGILVLPLLLMGFVFRQHWRWAAVTMVLLVLVYGLYFSGYTNPSGISLTSLFDPVTFAHLLALDTAFLGAMFYHPAVHWLPQAVGWITGMWTVYLLVSRYDRTNPTLFWMLIFLQLTGLMLAINRIDNPVDVMFASRYKNVTALVVAVTYLTIVDKLVRQKHQGALRWFVLLAGAVSVSMCVISNETYFSKIVRFRELKQTDQVLWERYGIIRGCSPVYEPARQLSQLSTAGIFRPEPLTLDQLTSREIALTVPTPNTEKLVYTLNINRRDGDFLIISGFAKIDQQKANFNDTFLAVESPEGWRFFTTLFHQRLDNDDSLNNKDTGFTAIVPLSVAGKSARLGLLVKSGGKTAFQPL